MPRHTFFLDGDVHASTAAAVVAFAQESGFRVAHTNHKLVVPVKVWAEDELRALESDKFHPSITHDGVRWLKEKGITNALDLTHMTFAQFVEPEKCLRTQTGWIVKADVLEFMVEQGIQFSDLDPAAFLATPIEEADLTIRTLNRLRREQLRWLELLQFLTATELRDIRNFGKKCEDEVKAKLGHLGLALKGE